MPKYNVMKRPHRFRSHATTVAAAVVLASTLAGAQTRVAPPDNNYTPTQDVEMGRQAAADARKTLPLMHVVLRHGTAQASKATKYEVGQVAGAVLGAIIGGGWGQVISQGTQFGLGTAFLRFSREYERQADIEGAQIMARAGRGARQTPAAGWDCQRGVSIRPHRASRLTPKATCSASACRRTGGSGRARTPSRLRPTA